MLTSLLRLRLSRVARSSGGCVASQEGGQIAFGFMLLLVVIFMFFALAVDTGIWALDHRTAQNQVDSAALAGALELPDTTNVQGAAEDWFGRNGLANPAADACPDATGTWWFRTTDEDGDGLDDRVEVCQRRSSEVVFSALTGVLDIKVSARAAAAMFEEPLLYSIMAMDETDCPGFDVSGQGQVEVTGGGRTYTRSDCTGPQGALTVSGTGNAGIVSGGNEVVGDDNTDGNATPAPVQGVWIDDPFNFLTQPNTWPEAATLPVTSGNVNINGSETLGPGVYDRVSVGNGDTLTLTEGLYVFRNGLQQTGGTITSNGDEVLLYSACASWPTPCNGSDRAGDLSFSGGVLNLAGDLDHYNILFWIDRTSQETNPPATLSLVGSSNLQLEGIAYSLTSDCHLSGQGTADLTLNMSFICGTIDFSGQANITVDYDPIHAPVSRTIALVE